MASTTIIRYRSASAQVHDWGNGKASVSNVYSPTRRRGAGTKLMQKVVKFADIKGLILTTSAEPYGPHASEKDIPWLVEFYKKFGFKTPFPNKHPNWLIRHPSQKKHGV